MDDDGIMGPLEVDFEDSRICMLPRESKPFPGWKYAPPEVPVVGQEYLVSREGTGRLWATFQITDVTFDCFEFSRHKVSRTWARADWDLWLDKLFSRGVVYLHDRELDPSFRVFRARDSDQASPKRQNLYRQTLLRARRLLADGALRRYEDTTEGLEFDFQTGKMQVWVSVSNDKQQTFSCNCPDHKAHPGDQNLPCRFVFAALLYSYCEKRLLRFVGK